MPTLPFITPPAPTRTKRIGNLQVGELEVEMRGGLTVGESATISELLSSEQSSFVKGAQIADAIAAEEKISLQEAFSIIEKAIGGEQLEPAADVIRIRHATRIDEVAKTYAAAGLLNMAATVTALIRSRLDRPEWTVQDTHNLPKPLFDGLWQVALEEQLAEDTPSEQPSAEELGKPQPAPGKGRRPTGEK